MPVTLLPMGKASEQVRIPADLAADARTVAAALGKTLPEYATEVMRHAVARDLPRAAEILAKKAKKASGKPPPENE